VKLVAYVNPEGIVLRVSIVSGPKIFHDAASEALMKWRFKPAMRDGVNVSTAVVIAFNFEL
jgi:TonB family protein